MVILRFPPTNANHAPGHGPGAHLQLYKKYGNDVEVALVDRLPTPFGLVRSGVAPDHQDSKVSLWLPECQGWKPIP